MYYRVFGPIVRISPLWFSVLTTIIYLPLSPYIFQSLNSSPLTIFVNKTVLLYISICFYIVHNTFTVWHINAYMIIFVIDRCTCTHTHTHTHTCMYVHTHTHTQQTLSSMMKSYYKIMLLLLVL